MPDLLVMIQAAAAAGAVAALILLVFAWPWHAPNPPRLRLGWVLALGAGFFAGCGMLDLWPHWPPSEDRDRFLLILLPVVLAVELVAVLPRVSRWLVWLLRLALAGVAAPVLLHQTIYLADLAGPGSRAWSVAQASVILFGMAAALGLVWGLLSLLPDHTSGQPVAFALAMSSGAAGVTVMLSGYLRGGELGLPLAGALAGATLASLVMRPVPAASLSPGVAVVGVFGVLLLGRFFGTLTTMPTLCLFLAPLLAWVPECPGLRKLGVRSRAVVALLLVAIPLGLVVANAQRKFAEESVATGSPSEPSLQDYMDFGK